MNVDVQTVTESVRIPLHSLQADLEYLIGRVIADGSCGPMIIKSMRERLDQIEAVLTWRPIESAPRDGTPFLCFHPDDVFSPQTGIDLIWYEPSIKTYTMGGDTEVPFAGITHWMPLPISPAASQQHSAQGE